MNTRAAPVIRVLVCSLLAFLAFPLAANAQHREPDGVIALWPDDAAPGSQALDAPLAEEIVERSEDPETIRDRYVAGITRPRLLVLRPETPNGAALLMLPGGGYMRVVLDKEGIESAERFNAAGITVFILVYRLPSEGHENGADVPLQDAQRALRLIRAMADEYAVDPDRTGVIGFSAGGHLAGSIATRFDAPVYAPVDAADTQDARPDFAALIYPVTRMTGPAVHAGSRDRLIGADPAPEMLAVHDIAAAARADAPPLFLLHAADDTSVPVANSLDVFDAFTAQSVPVDMHVFSKGGHGFGIRYTEGLPVAVWPDLVVRWMERGGFLPEMPD